jgi:hypothetical protein
MPGISKISIAKYFLQEALKGIARTQDVNELAGALGAD